MTSFQKFNMYMIIRSFTYVLKNVKSESTEATNVVMCCMSGSVASIGLILPFVS